MTTESSEVVRTEAIGQMPAEVEEILSRPLEERDDIIICRNVFKWFGDFCVMNDVSIEGQTRRGDGYLRTFRVRQVDIHQDDQPPGRASTGRHHR